MKSGQKQCFGCKSCPYRIVNRSADILRSVSAVISSIFWSISAIQLRRVKYDSNSKKLEEARLAEAAEKDAARAEAKEARRRAAANKTFVQRWWPWAR